MALTATMYTFEVALSDVDRGVYETLTIKAACHPSEAEDYFATRVLAYCLEYTDSSRSLICLSSLYRPMIK